MEEVNWRPPQFATRPSARPVNRDGGLEQVRLPGRWAFGEAKPPTSVATLARSETGRANTKEERMARLRDKLVGSRSHLLAGVAIAAVAGMALGVAHHAFAASKGLLVVFMPPGTDNYLAQWQKGARAKAQDIGYDIKIIESSRDQAEQDSQVQQELASGEKVDGFIWWPYVNAAGTGSLR